MNLSRIFFLLLIAIGCTSCAGMRRAQYEEQLHQYAVVKSEVEAAELRLTQANYGIYEARQAESHWGMTQVAVAQRLQMVQPTPLIPDDRHNLVLVQGLELAALTDPSAAQILADFALYDEAVQEEANARARVTALQPEAAAARFDLTIAQGRLAIEQRDVAHARKNVNMTRNGIFKNYRVRQNVF